MNLMRRIMKNTPGQKTEYFPVRKRHIISKPLVLFENQCTPHPAAGSWFALALFQRLKRHDDSNSSSSSNYWRWPASIDAKKASKSKLFAAVCCFRFARPFACFKNRRNALTRTSLRGVRKRPSSSRRSGGGDPHQQCASDSSSRSSSSLRACIW